MKRNRLYIAALLALSASCSDNVSEQDATAPADYAVTASIAQVEVSSRLAEKESGILFQKGDLITIGWNAAKTYQYAYTGTANVFHPDAGDSGNKEMWKDLLGSNARNIYAWCRGTTDVTSPAAGSSVSVKTDQTKLKDYLSGIIMVAHTAIANAATCKSLNFEFKHQTACFLIHLKINDMSVTATDVIGASAELVGAKTAGTLSNAVDGVYQLTASDTPTENIKMYQCPWDEQDPYLTDFKCLLPPQELAAGQQIIVTLASGKKYTCSLGGTVTLEAGKENKLDIEIRAKEGISVFTPTCLIFENAPSGAFSGNRIISAVNTNQTGTGDPVHRYYVYDKRPDGSWTTGDIVYEDEDGKDEFPTIRYAAYQKESGGLAIYGDYAVLGYSGSGSGSNARTFFIKKSKTTGKWYCSDGPIGYIGYAVAIGPNFLATGNHVSVVKGTYIYPINEDGTLGEGVIEKDISGYKMSMSGNILATNSGVYRYNENLKQWDFLFEPKLGQAGYGSSTRRISTDGKKVIVQDGGDTSVTEIYDIATNTGKATNNVVAEEWETDKGRAGVGAPIGIYGDYALVSGYNVSGSDNNKVYRGISICYRNPATGKWRKLGSFVDLMKRWNPSITLTEATVLGGNISLKGTRALITSGNTTYFIENIDEMVQDWLKDHPINN